jgi:arsenite-transporting ATPase
MRIIIHTGKGGVGKTSVSAATGLELARRGLRTLVMSVDPAHSLSDCFDRPRRLMTDDEGRAIAVGDNLWIQEIDVQQEIERQWDSFYAYIAGLLNHAGVDTAMAEEMAIFPGMEELSALLNLTQYVRDETFDAVVLDCAPTAEALRFLTVPTTLEWYMRKIFPLERRAIRVAAPVLKHFTTMSLPTTEYFENVEQLYAKLRGVDKLLADGRVTTVRLVTNPEKMVLQETQRAFSYLCLCGLTIDSVIVNRVLPPEVGGGFFAAWKKTQERWLDDLDAFFAPVPIWRVPLFRDEVLGVERLEALGRALYDTRDPSGRHCHGVPFRFSKVGDTYRLHLPLPFVSSDQIELYKKGDELIVRVGALKRHVALPQRLTHCKALDARVDNGELVVTLGPGRASGAGSQ